MQRWLLPSFIARVLIPLGFMPGNLLAGEYLLPCPSAMPATVFAASATEQQAHNHHDYHAHHAPHNHVGHPDSQNSDEAQDLVGTERQCPLGLVLGVEATLATTTHAAAEPRAFEVHGVTRTESATVTFLRPYRSRAPPVRS